MTKEEALERAEREHRWARGKKRATVIDPANEAYNDHLDEEQALWEVISLALRESIEREELSRSARRGFEALGYTEHCFVPAGERFDNEERQRTIIMTPDGKLDLGQFPGGFNRHMVEPEEVLACAEWIEEHLGRR